MLGKLSKSHTLTYLLSSLAILLTSIFMTGCLKTKDFVYHHIKFYEEETKIGWIAKEKNELVTPKDLERLEKRIPGYNVNYIHLWSYEKDSLRLVNFSDVLTNASVYLYRYDDFDIRLSSSVVSEFEIIDFFIENNVVSFKVKPLENRMFFVKNNDTQLVSSNDVYSFSLNEEVNMIKIEYFDEVEIIAEQNQEILYNGSKLEVDFNTNKQINKEEFQISYYLDSKYEILTNSYDVGDYYFKISYKGLDYQIDDFYGSLKVKKATPTITSNVSTMFETNTLDDVPFDCFVSSTLGTFEWNETDKTLLPGTNSYRLRFIPFDTFNYNNIDCLIEITMLTNIETLNIVKQEKAQLHYSYDLLNDSTINENFELPIKGSLSNSKIEWFSTSTVLKVENGITNIIGNEGLHKARLYAIISLGNAMEYFSIDLNILIDSSLKPLSIPKMKFSKPKLLKIDEYYKPCSIDIEDTFVDKTLLKDKIDVKVIDDEIINIDLHQFIGENISEVIFWRIISDTGYSDLLIS